MSRRRQGFSLIIDDVGGPRELDLVKMAQYWTTHSNNQFHDLYGFDWPFDVGDASKILEDYRFEHARQQGAPSKAELLGAIALHDAFLGRINEIIERKDPGEIPERLVFTSEETLGFDRKMEGLIDRLAVDQPSAVLDWKRPHAEALFPVAQSDNAVHPYGALRRAKGLIGRSKALFEGFAKESDRGGVVNYNITIKDVVGPVNVLSRLDRVVQSVSTSPSLSSEQQLAISKAFEELKVALSSTPAFHAADAELVSEQAESIAEELKRPQRRPSALKIKASGLIEAARALAAIVPTAIDIAKRIAQLVVTGM